jgi:protein-S-isoprenylcysteine O-methyltransferase Ste14
MTRFESLFVWTGGALFVFSLAACVFWYSVLWSGPEMRSVEPIARSSGRAIAIDAGLFAIFALHHSLFARESIKRRMARLVRDRLRRSVYVWTASLLLLCVLALWQPIAGDVYHVTGWRAILHAVVQLSGLWLIARSVARIDPLELAGIKPESESGPLQIAGPYRWVRHPLYLGWVIAVFGAAHMTGNRLAFAAISTAYLLAAIPWEERSLRRTFGDSYARYQGAVRWRIVPFVY